VAVIGALIYTGNVSAAIILEHSGTVELGTDYHTNLQFLNDKDEKSVYLYSIVPEYKIKALDDKNEWYGSVGINLQRSSNENISGDREDPFAKVGWVRTLQSGKLELVAEYSKESSRTTQFTQTGVLTDDGTTVARSVGGNWTYAISPKLDMVAKVDYVENTFSGVSELSDFNTTDYGIELNYLLSDRIRPYASVVATDYKASGLTGNSHIRYQSYLGGADFAISPKFNVDANVGIVQFNSSAQDEAIGGVTASYTGDRYQIISVLERTVFPTGLREIEVGDAFRTNYSYNLSSRSAWGVGLSLTQNNSNIDTQDLTGFYDYDLSSSWLLHVEAGARYLKSPGQESVNDTSLGVFFTYTSPKF
jgi:hypothetical protein